MENDRSVALVLNAPTIDIDISETDVIVADGGLRHIKNKSPIAIIGDFDSLGYVPDVPGAEIITHSVEKNATDGELSVDYAASKGYTRMTIYGLNGGRFDQVIGNLNLLPYACEKGIVAVARSRSEEIYFCNSRLILAVAPGETISVIPYGGDATVTASGLYYPLNRLELKKFSSRGISNVATSDAVEFEVICGAIIVVRNFSR